MAHKVPNLDCMDWGELLHFKERYGRCSRDEAALLIGDRRPGYTKIARQLAQYANIKSHSARARERGMITLADGSDKQCDRLYESLPSDLRW